MTRTSLVIGALVVAFVGAFSYGIYRNGVPQQSIKEISRTLEDPEQSDSGPQGLADLGTGDEAHTSRGSDSSVSGEADASGTARALPENTFVFKRLNIDTAKPEPAACLTFSQDLDESGTVRYEDYVTIENDQRLSVTVQDDQLCLAGLEFAEKYRVQLRKGLPSASGKQLLFDEDIPIELKDRPALIQFGDGLILPRESVEGITLKTVNVETLDIRVLRVGDRLLSQLQTGVVDQKKIYEYDEYQVENEQGQIVWEGQMDVDAVRNQSVDTKFDFREAVPGRDPGVYLIVARDSAEKEQVKQRGYYSGNTAAQWVIDSDIGLATFEASNGLYVFARSLQSAEALRGVDVALIARNNEELARIKTDGNGLALFPDSLMRGKGGAEPVVAMAYGGKDFNYTDLRRPAFDLTDRGVGGRSVPGPIDAYLYTDRGIYRPGEQVHLVTMLRNQLVESLNDVPLSVSIRRPDGVEFRKLTTNEQSDGASYLDVTLSATAPRGRWQAVAYVDTDANPVGRVSFDVQDFVPQRLEVNLEAATDYWQFGEMVSIDVASRFLYGAPASDLDAEAELTLMIDPNPFPDFVGYSFGRIEEKFNSSLIALDVPPLDAEGKSTAIGTIDDIGETTLPLRARVRVAVFEPGGRTTQDELYRPVRTGEAMIGIRPNFEYNTVREGAAASFDVVALDKEGIRIARDKVSYRLIREETYYHWYQENNRWRYEAVVRDRDVTKDEFSIGINEPEKISETLPWGRYRLIVSDLNSDAATSVRFYVGWGGSTSNNRPDRVSVLADKEVYRTGETARIEVKPPVAGKALMVVASDQVFETKLFDVPAEGRELEVPVSEDWGAGAYVMVSVYKPLSSGQVRAPVRSIGLTWLQLDKTEQTLTVELGDTERVTPRGDVRVPVKVVGLATRQKAHVTLAAVDEGILQLTKFKTPAPENHYFSKRRLGVDIRDDYGRLISGSDAELGELRAGGDGVGGSGLSVVPTRTVALFSGIVQTDGSGEVDVELTIPDFNGELRLMAVAMTEDQIGHGERPLTVRDDVVAELTLPRFLAPGDKGQATLLLHNVDGAPGSYRTEIELKDSIRTASGDPSVKLIEELATDQKKTVPIEVAGGEPGIGTVVLTLTGPDDYKVVRTWPIEIRPAQSPISVEMAGMLAPGESLELSAKEIEPYYPDSVSVGATLSSSRGYDVPGLLNWLDRYPYGCLEQTVSRAFPLVYFNDMALLSNVEQDETVKSRVQQAVDRVVDMQNPSGSFGMWGPDYSAYHWLNVFALDFLIQAQQKDYVVPNEALYIGKDWLRRIAGQDYTDLWTRSYAFYVLAKAGTLNPGDLRYFADTQIKEMENPMSAAHLGAALVEIGDRSRSLRAFNSSLDLVLEKTPKKYQLFDYGSKLRDLNGVIALAAASGENNILPALFQEMDAHDTNVKYTTTQEKAWMLFAAYELNKSRGPIDVQVKGTEPITTRDGDSVFLTPNAGDLGETVSVRNRGDKDIWQQVTIQGTPIEPLPAEANGLTLSKTFWTRQGQQIDLSDVKQNDQIVVLLSGQMEDNTYREMIALDLLPAGWEIEGIVRKGDTALSWLPALSWTTMAEKRDDRFVAAFNIGSRYRMLDENKQPIIPKFNLAYIVRAVTPGEYALPAALVEDMYAPRTLARTDQGRVSVGVR